MYITNGDEFNQSVQKAYKLMETVMKCDMPEEEKKSLFNHFMMDFYYAGFINSTNKTLYNILDKLS